MLAPLAALLIAGRQVAYVTDVRITDEDMRPGLAPLSVRRWIERTAGDAVAHVEVKGHGKGTRRSRKAARHA